MPRVCYCIAFDKILTLEQKQISMSSLVILLYLDAYILSGLQSPVSITNKGKQYFPMKSKIIGFNIGGLCNSNFISSCLLVPIGNISARKNIHLANLL